MTSKTALLLGIICYVVLANANRQDDVMVERFKGILKKDIEHDIAEQIREEDMAMEVDIGPPASSYGRNVSSSSFMKILDQAKPGIISGGGIKINGMHNDEKGIQAQLNTVVELIERNHTTIQTLQKMMTFQMVMNQKAPHGRRYYRGKQGMILTGNRYVYKYLADHGLPLAKQGHVVFSVKAQNDAHIILSSTKVKARAGTTGYEIVIGGWRNGQSVIRRKIQEHPPRAVVVHKPLSGDEFREFWVSWENGSIAVGTGCQVGKEEFMVWNDAHPLRVNYIGVSTGWGASAVWDFTAEISHVITSNELGLVFALMNSKKTWQEAGAHCKTHEMVLATIGTSKATQFIGGILVDHKKKRIIHQMAYWINMKENAEFDKGKGDCMAFVEDTTKRYTSMSLPCTEKFPIICERPLASGKGIH